MKRTALIAAIGLAATLPSAAVANASQCLSCHTVDKGVSHRAGPNLYKICGKPVAGHPDFRYSKALQAKGGHWNYAEILALVADARAAIPGSRMITPPVRDEAKQKAIVADLESRIGCTFAK